MLSAGVISMTSINRGLIQIGSSGKLTLEQFTELAELLQISKQLNNERAADFIKADGDGDDHQQIHQYLLALCMPRRISLFNLTGRAR
jgi:hypothetical protein